MRAIKYTTNGILAGVMVATGCGVYLACNNRVIGAVLFSVALLTICLRSYSLYTGKIGLIISKPDREKLQELLFGLVGNIIGTVAIGVLLGYAIPSDIQTGSIVVSAKLEQTGLETIIRSTLCGVLMYVAVIIFRENRKELGILFCIPVFILSGYGHSIADIGYFAIAHVFSIKALIYIVEVIVGNTIGSIAMCSLERLRK